MFEYYLENHHDKSKEKFKLKCLITTNATINYGNHTEKIIFDTNDEIIWDINVIINKNNINYYKPFVSEKFLIITTDRDSFIKIPYICLDEMMIAPGSGWEAII